MRFQVLATVSMKMTSFWDIKSFSLLKLTDVSEVRTASIIRAIRQHYTSLVLRDHKAPFPEASHAHLDSNVVLVRSCATDLYSSESTTLIVRMLVFVSCLALFYLELHYYLSCYVILLVYLTTPFIHIRTMS
jgi:hypothetical protein